MSSNKTKTEKFSTENKGKKLKKIFRKQKNKNGKHKSRSRHFCTGFMKNKFYDNISLCVYANGYVERIVYLFISDQKKKKKL